MAGLQATFFSSITNPSTRFVNSLVYTGVGIIGAITAIKGFISVGQLTSFLSYANQYTKPFNEISGVITELQNALASAARVFELIDEDSEVAEPADAHELTDVHGEVNLKNVDFSYNKDVELIKNLNLNVKDGQRIAIVGPTGCGKSTVINLLMRFYDVDAGSISVDGYDIREVTRKSLRGNYGMVLQETWLKSGTIKDNIAYGRSDATDEEIIEAAKQSHAHSFIKRLPDGYNTYITEDGGNLSQGQKQLLCITRVMLDLPPMLILDEATSSIDTESICQDDEGQNKLRGRTQTVDHQGVRCHPRNEGRTHHRTGKSRDTACKGWLLHESVQFPVCKIIQNNCINIKGLCFEVYLTVQSFLTVVVAFICYISRTLASGGLCVYNVCGMPVIIWADICRYTGEYTKGEKDEG